MNLKKFVMPTIFLIILVSLGAVSANDNHTADCISDLNDSTPVSNPIDTYQIGDANESGNSSAKEEAYVSSYRFSCDKDVIYGEVYPWDLENPFDLNGNGIYMEQSDPLYNLTGNVTFYFDGEIVGDDMVRKYSSYITGYIY